MSTAKGNALKKNQQMQKLHANSKNAGNNNEGVLEQPECEAFMLTAKRAEAAKCIEHLPNKWQKFIDYDSGYAYYWNSETQESTYDRPASFETNPNPFNHPALSSNSLTSELLAARRKASDKPLEVNGGWEKYRDPATGFDYWWSEELQESTYDRPANFVTKINPFEGINAGTDLSEEPISASNLTQKRLDTNRDQKPFERNGGWEKFQVRKRVGEFLCSLTVTNQPLDITLVTGSRLRLLVLL